MILFCFVLYIAAQFAAAAGAFTANFGMSSTSAVLLGATIIVVYCLLGGFWAGGPGAVLDKLAANGDLVALSWRGDMAPQASAAFIVGIASVGLGTVGQPHLIARLMAVRGERERRRGFAIAITWAKKRPSSPAWLKS